MRYRVNGEMTISVHVDVEADSEEEAREKAGEAHPRQLCNGCASSEPDCWNTSGELDGAPEITGVVKIDAEPRRRR